MDYRKFMAGVAIAILLTFMAQTMIALTAVSGVGVGAYLTSSHFVFSIFVILVIYILAWRE